MRRPALISSGRSVLGYSTLHPTAILAVLCTRSRSPVQLFALSSECSQTDTSSTWRTSTRAEDGSPPEDAAREGRVGALLAKRRQEVPCWVAEWEILIAVRLVEDGGLLQKLLHNF